MPITPAKRDRLAAGLCLCCDEPRVTALYCAAHAQQRSRISMRHQAKRIADGRCQTCNQPLVTKRYCARHAQEHRERSKAYQRRRRAATAEPSRVAMSPNGQEA